MHIYVGANKNEPKQCMFAITDGMGINLHLFGSKTSMI
jgi:hypothetical protein